MTLVAPFWGEFFGTMVVIVLGNGVVAGALLSRSKGQGGGWLAITTGWAVAVFAGVAVASAMGDADGHLNPAFTVASVLMTGHASRLLTYIPAQMLGAFVGRGAGVAALQATLGGDAGARSEVWLFLLRRRRFGALYGTSSARCWARLCWCWWRRRCFRGGSHRVVWRRGWGQC